MAAHEDISPVPQMDFISLSDCSCTDISSKFDFWMIIKSLSLGNLINPIQSFGQQSIFGFIYGIYVWNQEELHP